MAKKKKEEVPPIEEFQIIKVDLLRAHDLNPNEMTPDEFELLKQNIKEIGFKEYPLVVPVWSQEDGSLMFYRIQSGAHRVKAAADVGLTEIPCILGDPEIFDEAMQTKQLVRMNKIKGHLNIEKFNALVDHAIEKGYIDMENAALELGFADESEFDLMREVMAQSLPTPELQAQYKEMTRDAKTVDDLVNIVNKLLAKFGNTLPANWMVVDIGTKKNLWVRMDARHLSRFKHQAQVCLDAGVTFDSFIVKVLEKVDPEKFVEEHRDALTEITGTYVSIDEFFLAEPMDEEVTVNA